MESSALLRPLSYEEIVQQTFALYLKNFGLFVGISAIPQVLPWVVDVVRVLVAPTPGVVKMPPGHLVWAAHSGVKFGLIVLVEVVMGFVAYGWTQGAAVLAVTDIHLGRRTTIQGSLRRAWKELGAVAGTSLLSGLAMCGGLILLIVPGLYVLCRLAVCVPVTVVESRGPSESLSRSWELTDGFVGRACLLFVLFFAFSSMVESLIGWPMIHMLEQAMGIEEGLRTAQVVESLWNDVLGVLLRPLLLIPIVIFYFDLRVRKEKFAAQNAEDLRSEGNTRGTGGITPLFPQ